MNIKKTANLLINFTTKRLAEIFGILIFFGGIFYFLHYLHIHLKIQILFFQKIQKLKNIFGFQGSFISDLFFQSIGLIAYLISLTLIITGINIFRTKEFFLIIENIFFSIFIFILGSFFNLFLFKCIYILYKWKWWICWKFI